jgi:hypothetical protein
VYPAFQTPGGLPPQSVREYQSAYAQTEAVSRQLDRRTDGRWRDYDPLSASVWTATPPAVLTWDKSALPALRYKRVGSDLRVSAFLLSGTLSANSATVFLRLPEGLRATHTARAIGEYANTSTAGPCIAYLVAGDSAIGFYRFDGNWLAGPMHAAVQMVIEVEDP